MDAERRAAERAARADPQDPTSARALAEALRRSGDRRALFHALCALARAGDAEAAAEVEAWHPWPGPDGRGNRRAGVGRPVRDPVRTRVARLPVGVPRAIAGASATHLFVVCAPPGWTPQGTVPGEVLVAVDLATLEVAWRAESEESRVAWHQPALLMGEEVAWGTGDLVRVVSARDGAEFARLPLALGTTGDGHALHADGDRLAVLSYASLVGSRRLRVFDVYTTAVLWELPGVAGEDPVCAFDGELSMSDGRAFALSNGERLEPRWRDGGATRVARVDRGDLVALLRSRAQRRLARLGSRVERRWVAEVPGESAPDVIGIGFGLFAVISSSEGGLDSLHVHDLESGGFRWGRPLPSPTGPIPARSVAVVGGHLVVISAGSVATSIQVFDPTLPRPSIPSVDLTLDLPLLVRPPFRDIARVDFAELVALDGALLVVATGDEGDLVVARVEGA